MSLVIIAGRLGKDATVETTSGGTKVVKFSVVENEFKNGEETSTWYDVTSFNPFIIEKQIKALKKGSFIVAPADLNVRPSFSKNGQLFLNYDAIISSVKIINVNGGKRNDSAESSSSESSSSEEENMTTGVINNDTAPVAKVKKSVQENKVSQPEPKPYVDDSKEDGDELPF